MTRTECARARKTLTDTNLGRGCRRPHHFLVAASVPFLLVVGVFVSEPPTGRERGGRPRDGRLGLAAAVLPCIVGIGAP